jgi:hypothetical protein
MSTDAILLTFVIVFGLGVVAALVYIWWLHGELDRLHGSHARPRERGAADAVLPDGAGPAETCAAGPAPAPRQASLLAPVRHAQAMHEISQPYLPEAPDAPWPPAGLPAHAEPQQEARPDVTMSDLPVARPVPDVLPTAAELREEYFRWKHPVYGQTPVADVLEGERPARVMLP